MTAQVAERLIFEGKEHALLSNPMTDYFDLGGHKPDFQATSSATWCGYVGSWEVIHFLTALEDVTAKKILSNIRY